jgi:hypothetical protein
VRFSPPTQRISLRSARSRRRRKESDVDLPRAALCSEPRSRPLGRGARLRAPSPSRRRIEAILKTSRERAEEKRQEKLDLVREQVENGSLVIRKMTKDERRLYPPKPDQPKGSAKR